MIEEIRMEQIDPQMIGTNMLVRPIKIKDETSKIIKPFDGETPSQMDLVAGEIMQTGPECRNREVGEYILYRPIAVFEALMGMVLIREGAEIAVVTIAEDEDD